MTCPSHHLFCAHVISLGGTEMACDVLRIEDRYAAPPQLLVFCPAHWLDFEG